MQNKIIQLLENIDATILQTQNISIEQLKLIILITYNECLSKEQADPIIKSFLTVVCKHFIDLENDYQKTEKFKTDDIDLISKSVLVERSLDETTTME